MLELQRPQSTLETKVCRSHLTQIQGGLGAATGHALVPRIRGSCRLSLLDHACTAICSHIETDGKRQMAKRHFPLYLHLEVHPLHLGAHTFQLSLHVGV